MESLSSYIKIALALSCLFANVHVGWGKDIIFYDEDGSVFTLTIKGGCYNFKPKWDNRATSVDIEEGCFTIYKASNCELDKVSLGKGSLKLDQFGFDKDVSSARLCNPEEEQSAVSGGTGGGSAGGGETETVSEKMTQRSGAGFSHSQRELWDAAVEEHNKFRRIHGTPDIKGNEDMHRDAQEWADRLARNHEFKSTTMGKYGNNLATSFRRTKVEAIRDVVQRWYSKIKFYDFERPGYNIDGQPTGSFTAVVWKGTTDLGVGIAWDEREESWIVNVFYSPPALRGHFQENVPRPKGQRK